MPGTTSRTFACYSGSCWSNGPGRTEPEPATDRASPRVDRNRDRRRRPEEEFPDMAQSPYKRRKPNIIKNFWIYRRLIALAFVLGLMLWFIWANDATVTVAFPFVLGTWKSTTGLVILLSALVGSVMTALAMTLFFTLRRAQAPKNAKGDDEVAPLPDDRPPADYAKTTE